MTTGEADLLTSILQGVVTQGTGKRAALPDRPTAGKTGTTDNYGDAWFVGLHAAARRRRLGRVPRQAAADADRVRRQAGRRRHAAGADLARVHDGSRQAAQAEPRSSSRRRRTSRRRTSGSSGAAARTSSTTATARARASSRTSPAAARRRRPSATRTRSRCRSSSAGRSTRPTRCSPQQPLGSELIGVPTKAGKHPGYVVKQEPRNGYLSANDTVRLYVTRPDPRYGLLPNLVGSSVTAARSRLKTLEGPHDGHLRQGPAGVGARADARSPGSPPARASR